jgi:hypothetical protein
VKLATQPTVQATSANHPLAREKIDFSNPEARKAHKISCISSRIEMLETKLANNDLPAGKARAFSEKVTSLQQKLENLKTDKTPTPAAPVKQEPFEVRVEEEEETYGRRGGRGRWGGNGRGRGWGNKNEHGNERGRGWQREQDPHNKNPELQLILSRVQDCKMELRAARQAKNEQDIQAKWDALQQVKAEWRAAKFGGEDKQSGRGCRAQRAALPEFDELRQKKEAKHVCMNNLRTARNARNQDDIEACHLALTKAKEELFAAKLALRTAKHGTQTGSL